MSMPPTGGWQPPQQSGFPHNHGQSYGQPAHDSRQAPPGWQGGWPQQSGPSNGKNSLKWLLICVAVVLVICISVGVTLLFTRDNGGGKSTPPSGGASDIASANDTGPVSVITNEPTCGTFVGINNSLGDVQDKGWGDQRGTLGPVSSWTPDQRAQIEAVANATRKAADAVEPLARQTPHRVVRELYGQFIAFGRAYADHVPNYVPSDNELASAVVNATSALVGICNVITLGSAGRSVAVETVGGPTNKVDGGDPANARPFISGSDESCKAWEELSNKFDADTADWQRRDTSIPASQWDPEQRAVEDASRPILATFANDMESLGRDSGNGVFEDFATSAAIYLRASIAAGNNYVAADSWLSFVAFRFNLLIINACHVTAG